MLEKYRLPNQIPGEEIIRVIRRDSFILFKKVLFFLFLIIISFVFFLVAISIFPNMLEGELSYPLIVVGSSIYYLFIWLIFFFSFIDFYLDVWIITSERIIDIKQHGFFSRVISEQRLDRVQDVTSEVHGIFQTVLNFGDVFIQTAGESQRFHFDDVPDPEKIRDIISKLIKKEGQAVPVGDSSGGPAQADPSTRP